MKLSHKLFTVVAFVSLIQLSFSLGQEVPATSPLQISFEESFNSYIKDEDPKTADRIKQMRPTAIPELREKILNKAQPSYERQVAMRLLETLAAGEASSDLLTVITDQNEEAYIRSQAALSLSRIGNKNDPRLFNRLKTLFETENDPGFRGSVLIACGRTGQTKSQSFLTSIISGKEPNQIKSSAIYGIGAIESESSTEILIKELKNENPNIAMTSARVLGKIKKSERAMPLILEKLEDLHKKNEREDQSIGSKIMILSEILGESGDKSLIPGLRKLTDSHNFLHAFYAAKALGNLGDLDSVAKIIDRAEKMGEHSYSKRLKLIYEKKLTP